MAKILLLYDTKEADLARDFKDFLAELDIPVIPIPLSPDLGLTLDQKERKYFESADGAIFLITPGSERGGVFYPSPSVTHELGQAKIKFQAKPEAVICLVDQETKLPAIEQITFIQLNRQNIRSAVSGLTQLVKNLKGAGFFRPGPEPAKSPAPIPAESILKSLSDIAKNALLTLCAAENGFMSEAGFYESLSEKHQLKTQNINFLKRDLIKAGVITQVRSGPSILIALTDSGWEIAKLQIKAIEDARLLTAIMGTRALGELDNPSQPRALSGAARLQALVDKTDPSGKK